MLSVKKVDDTLYSIEHDGATIFVGKYTETLAYAYWNFGIHKIVITKCLNLLSKSGQSIILTQMMDIGGNVS